MRIRLGLVAALAAVLVIGGCGSDDTGGADDGASESPSSTSSESSSPTAPESSDATDEPTDEQTMTAPGTVLKYGETARLSLADQGVIDVTVVKVEKGKPEHFGSDDSFNPSLDQAYYARSEVEVVSVEGIGVSSRVLFTMMTATYGPGRQLHGGPIPTDGKHRQCDYPEEPREAAPGDSFTTCNPLAVPKSDKLNGIAFDPEGTPYARFGGKPVYWTD